jgi:hypothetical protein
LALCLKARRSIRASYGPNAHVPHFFLTVTSTGSLLDTQRAALLATILDTCNFGLIE